MKRLGSLLLALSGLASCGPERTPEPPPPPPPAPRPTASTEPAAAPPRAAVHFRLVAVGPDGRTLASVAGSELRVWDVEAGTSCQLPLEALVLQLQVSESGSAVVLLGSPESSVAVGKGLVVGRDCKVQRELPGVSRADRLVVGPRAAKVARVVGSVVEVHDTETGAVRKIASKLDDVEVVGFADGVRSLAVRAPDGSLTVFDVATGKAISTCSACRAAKGAVARLSPDGKRAAFSLLPDKQELRVFELASGKATASLKPFGGAKPEGKEAVGMDVAFSPDASRAVVITYWAQPDKPGEAHEATLVDGKSWKPIEAAFDAGDDSETRGAYSFDAASKHVVAAGSQAAEARVWDASTGKRLRSFPVRGARNLRASADGRRLLAFEGGEGTLLDLDGRALFRFDSSGKPLKP